MVPVGTRGDVFFARDGKGCRIDLYFTGQPENFWPRAAIGPLWQLCHLETVRNPPRGRRGRPRGRLEAVLEAVPRGRCKTWVILTFLMVKGVFRIENSKNSSNS